MPTEIVLDGNSLTIEHVVAVARQFTPVSISREALGRLAESRKVVEAAAASDDAVYGINTGFGKLSSVKIDPDRLRVLQRNLILSHASGMGDPLPQDVVRALMLLRANCLVMPTSGVRPLLPERLVAMLNNGIHPVVPEQGSVGASGDLAPLAHVALALMGEGEVFLPPPSPLSPLPSPLSPRGGVRGEERLPAAEALATAGIEPVVYEAKEGLSLINGTQAQTACLSLLIYDVRRLWRTTHGAAAMTLEALKGTPDAFDARLHGARPHRGQLESASLMRDLLAGSEIRESHRNNDPRVQDAYSIRCIPQIMGAVKDTIDYAARVAEVELNSATDNPLVFDGDIVSGGNFHGQPVAMALDYLTVALTCLAGMAERRIERLVNPDLSHGLPAFLAPNPGLESGFMMVQIAAAALVGECRTLSVPACIQSVPTDANQEDIVPMSMAAAFKARRVCDNARRIVACELLCAAQGVEHHRPLRSAPAIEKLLATVREDVEPLTADRPLTADIERLTTLVKEKSLI
ncbi:MAG: histidine ammonia-lyase [Gemmatimonadetes bacterium]|nr:histidine ammonia-lyase [Gemmatimonadota bacterium]